MAKEIVTTNSKATDTYVPFGGQVVDLGDEAVAPAPEFPLLQYATGLPARRPKLDSEGKQIIDEETGELLQDNLFYAGFFAAQGQSKDLDEAMRDKNAQWLDIFHESSGKVVRHWVFEKTSLFIMAKGVPGGSKAEGECGIVYIWRKPNKLKKIKGGTVLYVQVILRQLLPNYKKPFVFTVSSTQTNDALKAIGKQYKVLERAHELRRQHGNDIEMPLWAFSGLFGASKTQDIRSNGTNSKTIFPMISGIPDDVPAAYLQRHEVPLQFVDHFKDTTEKAIEWAMALSQRIANGIETQEPWKGHGGDAGSEDHPF